MTPKVKLQELVDRASVARIRSHTLRRSIVVIGNENNRKILDRAEQDYVAALTALHRHLAPAAFEGAYA